jgi:hypothetical protein
MSVAGGVSIVRQRTLSFLDRRFGQMVGTAAYLALLRDHVPPTFFLTRVFGFGVSGAALRKPAWKEASPDAWRLPQDFALPNDS